MKQTITKFSPHTDNVNETISAEHVNELQVAVNELETNVQQNIRVILQSKAIDAFKELDRTCMFLLSSDFATYMDDSRTDGIKTTSHHALTLTDDVNQGIYVTKPIGSHLSSSALLENFSLLTDAIDPEMVEFKLLSESGEAFPFDSQGYCEFKEPIKFFRLQVNLTRTPNGEPPIIQLLSLYYDDSDVEKGLSYLK